MDKYLYILKQGRKRPVTEHFTFPQFARTKAGPILSGVGKNVKKFCVKIQQSLFDEIKNVLQSCLAYY